MKYCDNCGAQLEDDATFCDECGTSQEGRKFQKKASEKRNKKKRNKRPLIILCIILLLCIIGGGVYYFVIKENKPKEEPITEQTKELTTEQTEKPVTEQTKELEEQEEEEKTLKDRIAWENNEEIVTAFQERNLPGYIDKKIGEAIKAVDENAEWKAGEENDIPYLYVSYSEASVKQDVVFSYAEKEGMKIEEYYQNEILQDESAMKDFCERIFKKSEEELEKSNVEFVGKLDQQYEAEGLEYPAIITVGNQNGNMTDVNINVLDGTYDITYYGMITSNSIIQISLDGGEKVNLMWEDETTFNVFPADGFSDESVRLVRLLCESLNHVTYRAVGTQKQSNIKAVQPPSGTYWDGDATPEFANYYMEVSNVTDKGFDFVIYGKNPQNDGYGVVFMPHTAEYTDTYTAVYYGQEHTLTFQWQELGYMTVTGFEEWIPSGSSALYNTAYLGVS